MRAYSVDVAALALGVDRKYLDNLLSHHAIPGCIGVRQGVRRRIARDGVTHLAIVIALARELGMPLARAVDLGCRLHAQGAVPLSAPGSAAATATGELRIALDLTALERRLDLRLAAAIESAREPRRGRPPRRTAANTKLLAAEG